MSPCLQDGDVPNCVMSQDRSDTGADKINLWVVGGSEKFLSSCFGICCPCLGLFLEMLRLGRFLEGLSPTSCTKEGQPWLHCSGPSPAKFQYFQGGRFLHHISGSLFWQLITDLANFFFPYLIGISLYASCNWLIVLCVPVRRVWLWFLCSYFPIKQLKVATPSPP